MDQEGVEIRPIIQLDRHLGVQRGLLHRRHAPTPPTSSGERGRRLEGRHGHARLRARRLHDRPAGRLPARARRPARGRPGQRHLRRPRDPRPAGEGAGRARGDPAQRAAHASSRGPGAPAGQHLQAAVGRLAPHARRPRDAGARCRLADHRARLRPRRVAAAVPVHPRGHDLRRVRRDPAQRPGRARARPAPRAEHDDRHQTRAARARLRAGARPAARQGGRGDCRRRSRHRCGRRTPGARGGRQGRRARRHPRAPARRGAETLAPSSAPSGCARWSAT